MKDWSASDPFCYKSFRLYLRVHQLRVWDPENKVLVVPAWLAVELRVCD